MAKQESRSSSSQLDHQEHLSASSLDIRWHVNCLPSIAGARANTHNKMMYTYGIRRWQQWRRAVYTFTATKQMTNQNFRVSYRMWRMDITKSSLINCSSSVDDTAIIRENFEFRLGLCHRRERGAEKNDVVDEHIGQYNNGWCHTTCELISVKNRKEFWRVARWRPRNATQTTDDSLMMGLDDDGPNLYAMHSSMLCESLWYISASANIQRIWD